MCLMSVIFQNMWLWLTTNSIITFNVQYNVFTKDPLLDNRASPPGPRHGTSVRSQQCPAGDPGREARGNQWQGKDELDGGTLCLLYCHKYYFYIFSFRSVMVPMCLETTWSLYETLARVRERTGGRSRGPCWTLAGCAGPISTRSGKKIS